MNKIFKVIWSKSKQCYIVVSEMAKNHSGKKKIVVASILAAMAVGVGNVDSAAVNWNVQLGGGSAPTDGSIAIGPNALGKGTSYPEGGVQTVDPSIAIGAGAKAEGNSSLSIGLGATIDKKSYAVAIGRSTEVTGDYGVGIGYNVRSVQDGTAVGEQARSKKQGATALGVSSRGYSQGGVAIGWQSLAGANVYTAGVPGSDINKDNETDITNYGKWGDVAIGLRAMATGGNATAVGRSANATEANAIAIGGGDGNASNDNVEHTIASGEKAIAIGYKALASDKSATSIGTDAQARQSRATAIGYEVRAVGKNAVAIGSSGENSSRKLNSAGENAVAIGTAAQANNLGSTAIGNLALAANNNAIALGTSAEGTGESSTAIGKSAQAQKSDAIALGTDTEANEERAVAIGKGANAEQVDALALGTSAVSGGARGVAIGNNATAQEVDTIAIGSNAKAVQASDNAFGNGAKANGGGATAVGYMVNTTGNQAFGGGSNSNVSGAAAIGIGYKVTASGNRSISIGNDNGVIQTAASGEKAIAIGSGVQSTGSASTAIGKGAIANQGNAFAAGTEAKAQATDTVAIGSGVTASGVQSISIGSTFNNRANQATGIASVAIGSGAQSTGAGSVALGRNVQSLREYTTAIGTNITASNQASGSTIIGYNSATKGNQSVNIGSTNVTEESAQYSTAIGYKANVSGMNAIAIGSGDGGPNSGNVTASADNAIAIGTKAQASGASAMALGTNANAALAHSVALGEGSTTTTDDGASKIAYLTNESTNNSGNGVISVGNKRNTSDTGTITRRIVSVAGGTDDFDAVNVKQLKALESKERHIKVKTGNDAYTPDANGKITLNYVNGKGEDVPNEVTEIKDVAKKSDEWTLRTQDGNTTAVATPQTVNGLTKKAVTLKAGDNIAIENNNGVVTIKAKDVVKSVATDNTNALDISNTNGAVKINPKLASSVNVAGEANKLVTAGTVKTALDDKIDKTAEMHIKSGEYTVNTDGTASLIQQNGNNQDQSTRVTIKDIAKKSVVDALQSDYNTFKTKAITFTGDDNQGVARTLDTTLTVKGGANYTSTTTNTNIRVEKDAANGANGLLVKLSDKLSGMKEIAGTGSQDLVIKNGNTTVTVKAPANGDTGTVDFGKAKVVAPNLDASIKYRANDDAVGKAKSVKLADGFNFVASKDATTTAEGPKAGLAIKAEDNGKVTFGLDKETREKVDNAADKNLSNLSDTGKDKVKELAKTAAQDAVKVANGINTTVEKDTATAGVTTYKVNANDTTVAVTGNGLAITGGDLGTDKVRKYSLDLSAATKGKLAAVGNLANVIGGTTIATDGTVTGPTFSITNAAGTAENAGTIKEAIEKLDAANKGQNTKISETAGKVTTLEGKVTNLGDTVTNNYNDLSSKITQAGTNVTNALTEKGLNFTGNDTTDAGKVHRDLGTTLTIKGAENFTRAANENNIKVVKNGDALDVKLAENLANMKEISGDGTSDLVIKNGDTKVTVKAPTNGEKGTVDFGDAKVIAKNLDASIAYKSNQDTAKKTVKLQDGFNFTAATDTSTTAEGPKSGLVITTGDNGVVTFGLDKATREKVDNAADKNLSNLSDDGKNKVKELAKGAAQDAVKVADGINTTVEKDTATAGVTTYKVNANDTTVAVTGNGLTISGGELGTDKVRKYSLDLSDATKGKLKAVDGLSTVIGGTNITTDGTVTGPTFNITKADGTTEEATTIKDAIDKLNATNAGQNTKISETESKVKDIVDKGMTFAGDDAAADKVTRKLGETLNIHGQNNITVKKDGTAADTLNVKLASELKNITSISSGDGTTGSTVTLGADGVSIANTKDGATKTVTIGKDGINAGGMKITNVGEAKAEGDAANKKYVDDAISNLGNIVSGNATLNFAGNVTKNAQDQATEKVGLSLATGTLHVNGAENEITTTAKGDTITVGLAETVKAQLAKVGDTSSNGRDGKAGTSGAQGLTGKDGLNDKTLTDKVNALRNGEAGSVVYTDENGARLVKAKDGQYYKTTDVDATGNVLNNANPATTVEARVVNPDGTTTGGTTKLSNIADGKVAAGSKDVVNGGQLHTAKSEIGDIIGGTTINENGKITGPTFSITNATGTAENAGTIKEAIEKLDAANKGQNTKISDTADKVTKLATALGGGAKVENGTFTGPTYNITKADGTGTETASNVGEAITKLDTRITTANGALVTKGLDFTGNDTTDAGKVHRDLGTTLTIKGTENFTRAAAENNIKVVKNGDALDVKLAENLAKMKEISGDGASDLVIKNGDTKVTVKAPTNGDKGTVDFGDAKVVASNLDASIKYRANDNAAAKVKSVKLADGFNFVVSNVTDTAAEGPKSGLAISAEDNGKVTFGLDKATRSTIDNAADKDLSNLTDTGKTTVKELAKGAAQDAVKVANGINTTVTTDTTTAGVTTYKVNANDTTVAVNADTLAISGGDLDATTKVRAYTLDLSNTVKAKLNAINNVGDTASNGRDGKDGTSGAQGLTGKDGLNDKTLTDKVNALRNGEAGSVVYTDENGARLVKAKDGEYYKVADVDKDGNVLNGAKPATTVEARLVNPKGETTVPTKLSNIADGKVAAGSKDAVNGGQLHTVKSDLATALGGDSKVNADGSFTGPTYNITKADGTGTETASNVGDAISKLDTRITTANGTLVTKGLDFTGNDTTDVGKVHRDLGTTLTIKGAENFTRTDAETNNIKVVKNNNDLDVKLAENLGNIKSISNATGAGKPGSTITLGADSVSIANTAAGADGAAGETKTVTIGKDGINAGGMKITNVTKAEADGDAANKKYVDDAISNLGNIVSGNATLNFAGNVTKDAQDQVTEKVGLSLATGTLHVNGANNEITTTAKGDTITVGLAETVKAQLAKVGDTSSNGRDGKAGTSGAQGLTGKDGLNDKTLTDKVNALRNGEAGSVVYTDENGARLVKAKDGQYYKTTDVDATGNVLNNANPATTVEARVVNPDGTTTGGTTKLSNIADGKVAAGSKDAVNGGQLNTVKSDLATALGGDAKVENGVFTGPTYNITKDDGSNTTEAVNNVGDAISKLDGRINNANTTLGNKGLDFTGNDTTDAGKVHRNLGETLTIKGAENFTRTATETNNIKVVKTDNDLDVKLAENLGNIKSISNTTGEGKPGSTITLGADGVSIANTAAGQDGAAGETKTVTIGKDGINAGGMKITNVAKATEDGDAANKAYVDDAIKNLNTTVANNANLRYAGDTNEGAANGEDHLNLPLATGTLKVAGTADQIKTVANNGTITLSLDEKVTNKLDKLGDTASNGRDGANGLTGKDGLNDKTLTDKVNALRNGEAGTVVYTDDAGERVVKANDGKYYHKDDLKADGTPKTADENNGTAPKAVDNPQARVVNPNGDAKAPTTLSNIADGKVAADSKDAVNGGQLNTVKTDLATALGGGAKVENGTFTGPTYNITKDDGSNTTEEVKNVGDAISKLDGRINNANTTLGNKGLDFTGNDTTDAGKVHRNLGETLTIKGAENFTRTATETNNIKVVKTDNDLDVKLAENLGNIKSISNTTGEGKPGSTITLGADGVSIANTAAGQDGAAGETKTVTIGKDGINAGGMKITNVAKATEDGDAANKAYVDDAIKNLNTTVTNNANLRYAGDTNEGAFNGEDHLNLPLATGTLKVAGTADQIKTVANNGTITLSLDEKVTNKLAKLGDTASNGRDGVNGTSGANGLTGKDGLNDKTLTEKVNALRNGEAGSVVYTNDAGDRVVKAKDGKYYKADEVKADGTVKTAEENNGKAPKIVENPQARVVNGNGETTAPTTLSNIADGKVAADSKEAVNGGQLHTAKSEIGDIIGGTTINENGKITGPTFSITNEAGTAENAGTIKEAIEKLDATNAAQNTKISGNTEKLTKLGETVTNNYNDLSTKIAQAGTKGLDFTGNDTTDAGKVHRNLGETLTIKGAENFTRTATETNNIKVVKTDNDLDVKLAENLGNIKSISNTTGEGKPGSTITLGADGVSIANTAAGQDGAAGETKTVTIGKDGINAGGMKITNVAKATEDGDAANKAYVDDAIKNLNTTVANNANLRYAGDTNEGAANGEDHLNLPLATGTLKVAGTADQIKTVANNGTITLSLDEKVTNKLDKLGDTASNGRDGATGLTGKDGLNDKTLTDKVNALRNGEAGSVVYTNDAGDRVVKAKDGKYYKADEVKADGTVKTAEENNGKTPEEVTTPQARVVNPNGETTAPTTLSNIADGKVAANSKDAVNGGQLHTVKSDLAIVLGGDSKVNADGSFTGPTYNITKDDGSNTKEAVNNVGDAISKLDGRINNANTVLGNKGLDFYGNKDTADTDKVHRNLGEALKVKGAENFTREANAKNNIDVVKNTAGDGFDVKLAENLGNIKEIAGNGKDNLVIKNGDATITLKPKKEAEGTNPATPATVDFGDTKVVASNLDASIKYRANDEAATNAKSVKLADGFNFVASTDATTTAEGPKSGLAITAEDNGKVTFGLDKATREKVDNAADKNLSNLSDDGKNKVKELAKGAAQDAVKVADGINTTVTTDTATTGVTTYKVNANDTTVAVNADSLAIAGGDLDATTKVRAYTLDLSDTVKAKLNAINNVGDTASNGRDGVNGTSGATGLTGKDGLNDKTLTDKVNALRNGEAGSVVYTNDAGDRVVKAKDGKYYKADEVKADGTVKTAEENNGKTPEEVTTPQARVVNPNGETTAPTTLSNIADGKVAADSKEAVNGGQLNTVKSDLATALGGGAKVENGTFTGPTYNITKDDGTGTEPVNNVGEAITKLDGRINNANTALANKGLDFTGNDTTDAGKVHRNLGETLTIKGADNFTRTDAETNNIKVVKNNNDLDVKLAENLGNIKEIAGNGKDNLVIKNGDATITLKPKKDAEGTNPATPATVDFGNTKVVAPNLEASITYRANSAEDANAKTVTLQKGLNFVSGDGTAATAEAAKAGITIAADKDGKVVFGLNEATRNAIDNAADKNLSNLSQDGKDKVADLAKTAARDAVKVTAGNNVTVTSETKDGNTTYTVNGRDTTVKAADNGSVSVTGGTLNAKGEREYTVDLTADAKAELGKISDLNTRLGSAEGKITTLQGDMTKAKDDIAANTKAIDANKEAIAANKNAIADNARDIAANRKDIDANKQGIAENKKQIGENAKAIAKNAEDIKKNVEDTKKNTQDIKKNADAIKANTDRIQTVENRVTTAEGKIATNEKAIKDNASAIQSNTKAIGANTTAIAKNANDITKANKEIESLKGNSATKDLSNLTNTGKDTITKLIDVKGENGITVTPSINTESRVKTFTAKLNDTVTFGSGDKKITVDGTTGTVTSKAVAADTVKANTVNAKTVQLGDSTGTNTTVTADGIAVTTKNPDGTTSKVEIKNGTVSGLTNTKWDPAKVVTDADRSVVATQGQVKDVTDTLARGRVFVGDTGKTVTVGLGDTLAIKGGSTKALTDDNIGVVSTEAKDGKPATMTVKLAKDVKMKDGSTSYDYYLPEIKTNPDGSKEIVKNADGSVKHQLGKDGNPIRLVTTTVNGEGITIAPVKGLDKPTVSLTADGLDNGGNQIHNVAAGTANTDAATVGQVRAAAHALNNRVNEAGAHAAALAAMNPLSYDPLKKSQVMAGVGSYKGNKALALGVAHYANEDTLFNVGVAVGDGSNMVNAGVTYRFGGEYSAVPERYKGGPISSVYVMQDEVSALKAENAEMKEQMKMLMERIEMLAAK